MVVNADLADVQPLGDLVKGDVNVPSFPDKFSRRCQYLLLEIAAVL
jgi:hypothetical protein